MKRVLYILVLMLLSAGVAGAQGLDSLAKAGLGEKIEAYFGALAGESLEVQKSEADFMIGLSADSSVRQFTAQKIYEYYVSSPVMGAENVAVHVFDEWFGSGQVMMNDELDFLNARIFADFNRQSLVGNRAPELIMESYDGSPVRLFTPDDRSGKYRVLFFYDSGCAKCKLESILLRNMLDTEDFPIEFYAIYAGDDRDAWTSYIRERFDVSDDGVRVAHLWDPEIDSDFQRKYGVIRTPRMFLIDPEGVIVGRGLDAKALSVMLRRLFDVPELEYGGEESVRLFDGIFEGKVTSDDVKRVADYIDDSTLGEGDPLMFRQLTGDLLYYLSARSGEAFKEGAEYLIRDKIFQRPDVWKSPDDSLKVVGLARFMDGLLDKSRPGTEIAGLKLPAEHLKSGRIKKGKFRLDRLRGTRNIIIFYTEGCRNCEAEKAAALELSGADRKVRVLFVNVDEILSSSPGLAGSLFESFDLSTLPFILETNRKGTVLRRYLTLI